MTISLALVLRNSADLCSWNYLFCCTYQTGLFVAGVGMVTSGVLNLMGRIVTFRWVSALMNFYIIVFGLLAIVLEGRKWLPIPKSFETIVRKYALFLDFIWGRGVIYFFIGSLQLSLVSILLSLFV